MRMPVLVVTAVSLGVAACGERPGADDSLRLTMDTSAPLVTAGGDTPVAAAPRAGDTTASAPVTPDGRALGSLAAASRHEMQHGQLAASRGSAKEVRDLGTTVARDHDDLVQRAQEIAAKFGIAVAGSGASDLGGHGRTMRDLRTVSSSEFDRAFLQHELEYNRWLVDQINSVLLPQATNDEVRTFLQQAVPILQAHAKAAEDILAKLR